MKVYKVLDKYKDGKKEKRMSASWALTDDCAVEYKEGEFVSAKIPNSKLFVFDTLENALKYFVAVTSPCVAEIWEAEAENAIPWNYQLKGAF